LIVRLPSLLALGNKSNLLQEAIPMHLSAVPHVDKRGRHDRTAMVKIAIEIMAMSLHPNDKCSLQCAQSVARKLKYHLNLARVDPYIAGIAFPK
jgi:hypothetical protein